MCRFKLFFDTWNIQHIQYTRLLRPKIYYIDAQKKCIIMKDDIVTSIIKMSLRFKIKNVYHLISIQVYHLV